ncbi:MAG: acylphosphatase [Acidiferrobacteraceae bacterium]
MTCRRFLVSGFVQGVAFRVIAQSEARALALTGFVRNLEDGRVEAVACGSLAALKQFEAWLAHGPPHARVTGVLAETWVGQPGNSPTFEIL